MVPSESPKSGPVKTAPVKKASVKKAPVERASEETSSENSGASAQDVRFRACNICEAICGLAVTVSGDHASAIRGDPEDPFSQGHLCPKGVALMDVHGDPDRLRTPMKKGPDGEWSPISWDAAFREIGERWDTIREAHGSHSAAVYLGNPTVHNYGMLLFSRALTDALEEPQIYSATSVDQLPHHMAAERMFGDGMKLPVPDIDRTEFMLILGANPVASNGSMMTAPGVRKRLKAIQERGGTVIVLDPRKTETAALATEHFFIQPGTDVWFLGALLKVMLEERLVDASKARSLYDGFDELESSVQPVALTDAAVRTGIELETIQRIARQFASSPSAVAYGRMGVSTQAHGGLCLWLINAINAVSGNLDRPGSAMFTRPAVPIVPRRVQFSRRDEPISRVRKMAGFSGHLPASTLADEMLESGPGQVRALVTVCGNPVLSTPNGRKLERGLESLDLHVAVDIYINETSRHADFILPTTTGLETEHYDLVFNALAVRNVTRFSEATLPAAENSRHDWQVLSSLASSMGRRQWTWRSLRRRAVLRLMTWLRPSGILDIALKRGPYGAWSSPSRWRSGLTLRRLRAQRHGVDLGALEPVLGEGRRGGVAPVQLAPSEFVAALKGLLGSKDSSEEGSKPLSGVPKAGTAKLQLIGRRHLLSNNSWLHNSTRLTRGKDRCTLMMHPDDAAGRQLTDGEQVQVTSAVGELQVALEVTDDIHRGVVSLPHGYGHRRPGVQLSVATEQPGVSINDLTDDRRFDPVTGNAAFSGLEVSIQSAKEETTR